MLVPRPDPRTHGTQPRSGSLERQRRPRHRNPGLRQPASFHTRRLAQQAQDAPAVRYDVLAVNLDIGLERLRQSHELVSGSQMESQDVVNSDLATGDMEVLGSVQLQVTLARWDRVF